jgi:hypothetical protein
VVNFLSTGSSSSDDALKAVALDTAKYVCGLDYFESANRWFPANISSPKGAGCGSGKCATVVHNNWIVSREAKIYRFKEHLMWMYDKGEAWRMRTEHS